MNTLDSREAKLLLFASRLPWFERTVMKELILDKDKATYDILAEYESKGDAERLKEKLVTKVVEATVNLCRDRWGRVFEDAPVEVGKRLAQQARFNMSLEAASTSNLTYGEVDFHSLAVLLEKVDPAAGEVFVDLGSGTGKAVIAAALLYGHVLGRCYGIELVPELHRVSVDAVEKYHEILREEDHLFGSHDALVEVEEGDITSAECFRWETADIVFVNSTCFDSALMHALSRKAENMRIGARVITLTKRLPSKKFQVLERKSYGMSWGTATCFTQLRTDEPAADAELAQSSGAD